ncbi:MAG TPA: sodium-dependent transporter [Aggregatilineaceae bacterium]|nr:sodium-dependent transporter [Aggregatilineaceae bacterium]
METASEGQKVATGEVARGFRKRDAFATGLGVLTATLGSAVGLGNIWKFPAMTGQNGGAAFIIVYLFCTLLVGLPVMMSEHMLGRRARKDAINTMRDLAPRRQPWWLIGAAGGLAAFLIMAFYSEVAGWVFAYVFKAASGSILSTDPATNSASFGALVSDPWQALLWQWIVLIWVGAIIMMGVSKGIERVTKKLLPLLFVLLIAVCVRSLTLDGAGEGIKFLFNPDFSKVTGPVVLAAMGLAFFKLSVGMGTMITYGSYFKEDQNIPATATKVMLADLTVSILAGLAIFPAVFALGFDVAAGPSLLFEIIPAVFASMPGGDFFVIIFFLLTAIAATGAMISIVEVPVAFLTEQFRLSRQTATLLTLGLLALVGAPAALSFSELSETSIFGKTFFDLYDYASSNILLPVGGLFICIFIGWVWGFDNVKRALSNDGALNNQGIVALFFTVVKYITPLLVLLVLLDGLNIL